MHPNQQPAAPVPMKKKENPFFNPRAILTILAIAVALNLLLNQFRDKPAPPAAGVQLTVAGKHPQGKRVDVVITNRTDAALAIADDCPSEPLVVEKQAGDAWTPVTATAEGVRCPVLPAAIAPGASETVRYSNWNDELFHETGRYRISLPQGSTAATVTPAEFDIVERGAFSSLVLTVLYQPLYNALVWLISVMPGLSLGFAIILLTFLVRGLLFIPTYRSLAHQADLQALQPDLEKIKKQHASDKEKQAQATMELYKERGVNPFGSCLPLLVQLPVLWTMYYVLRDGVDAANNVLLYPYLRHVDLAKVQTVFAGMDLLHTKVVAIAVIGAALQFLSMKLISWTMPKATRDAQKGTQAAQMSMIMTYMLPVFIGYLSYIYPAGLGLYWATSTLFGIGQQLVLKRAREAQATKRGGKVVRDAEFRDAA